MLNLDISVNGERRVTSAPARTLLVDLLRDHLGLTGTKIGCAHGVCGSCTVEVDGLAVRSCLMLAGQVDGRDIRTVEGLSTGPELHPLQSAFWEEHGLQCGFCTPGFMMAVATLVESGEPIDEDAARAAISGNICRCTGYDSIVAAVCRAAASISEGQTA